MSRWTVRSMKRGETWYERADACIAPILFLLVLGGMLLVGVICTGLEWVTGTLPDRRRQG